MQASQHSHDDRSARNGGGTGRWVFWGFVLIIGYFLFTEHRAHVIQYLPFLLVLACPLVHLFHRHGGHRPEDADKTGTQKKHSGGCH